KLRRRPSSTLRYDPLLYFKRYRHRPQPYKIANHDDLKSTKAIIPSIIKYRSFRTYTNRFDIWMFVTFIREDPFRRYLCDVLIWEFDYVFLSELYESGIIDDYNYRARLFHCIMS